MYAEVLIEYSAKTIDKTFTYIIPENLKEEIKIGMKVLIPFGNKTINGFVTNITNEFKDTYKLKPITDITDKNLCLNKEMMKLGEYLKEKTLCTKIAAYQTMLPSSLKIKEQKSNFSKYLIYIELNCDENKIKEYIDNNPRKKKNAEILQELLTNHKQLKNTYSSANINQLLEEKLIKITKEQIYRLNKDKQEHKTVTLSEDQQNA